MLTFYAIASQPLRIRVFIQELLAEEVGHGPQGVTGQLVLLSGPQLSCKEPQRCADLDSLKTFVTRSTETA